MMTPMKLHGMLKHATKLHRKALLAGLIAAATTGAVAGPAFADTVNVGFTDADTLTITGDASANKLHVDVVGGELRVDNRNGAPIVLQASQNFARTCRLSGGGSVALCALPPAVVANLGDGDDLFDGAPEGSVIASMPMQINGGVGEDEMYGGAGADTIDGGGGDDLMDGFAGDDTLFGRNETDSIYGGPGNDSLAGGENTDFLLGEDGNDTLAGENHDDDLNGGPGNDRLDGGDDKDVLDGGDGDDELIGNTDPDTIRGGAGADKLLGGSGVDTMSGDAGDDTLTGGVSNDTLDGGPGADVLNGESGDDVLRGGAENDRLDGGSGTDQLFGDDGDDYVDSQDGVAEAVIDCGAGNDAWYGDDLTVTDTAAGCETTRLKVVGTPTVAGTLRVGETVSPASVSFAGAPINATYQWSACVSDTACATLQSTATPTFVIPPAAAGFKLRLTVRATNAVTKSVSATSALTGPVAPLASATFGKKSTPKVTKKGSGYRIALGQPISCRTAAAACTATITATSKQGKKTVTVATASLSVASGKTGKVTLTLTKAAAKLLRTKGKLKLAVSIKVEQAGANAAEQLLSFTAKRPKR